MKQYKFEVVITEGCDEFWEEATKDGKTGCDEVLEMIRDELYQVGFDSSNCRIKMTGYEDAE